MSTATTVPAGTYKLDPVHSKASFAVKHAGISTFRGTFTEVDAELVDGTLNGSAKVESVDVPVDGLKAHLLGPEFFDAERFPEITFSAADLRPEGDQLTVTGELTMRGVTKPIEATGTLAGPATYFDGNERIAIELQTVVNRHDFGVSWNAPIPSGGNALADDVTITVELQLVRPADEA